MLVTVAHADGYGLLPRFDDSVVAGMLLLAVTVVGSIWLGRRSGGFGRWPRLAVNAGSALAALFGLVLLLDFGFRAPYSEYTPVYDSNPYSHVRDIYVYDSEGRLVEGARLFDQDGQPIRMGYPDCADPEFLPNGSPVWRGYPYCPQYAPFPFPTPSPSPTEVPTPAPSESGSSTSSPDGSILPTPTG